MKPRHEVHLSLSAPHKDAFTTRPHFIYHPDPLGNGSVQLSCDTCLICNQARLHLCGAGMRH
ncbi:CbrC family protein [Pseudomonas viridiflava]|uniref:CbrC family protein n=1 Tax=Pseudomonas viridiflava TaxID=33069 RepID=UPI0035BFAB4D